MNTQFKVGEICIGQNFESTTIRNGQECVVLKAAEWRHGNEATTGRPVFGFLHLVRWSDGTNAYVSPKRLRRKPPKQDLNVWAALKVIAVTKPVKIEEPA